MKKIMLTVCLAMACALVSAQNRSFKRGFGENTLGYEDDLKVLAEGSSWWYNWGPDVSGSAAALAPYMGKDKLIEFVPMAWTKNYDENKMRTYYQNHPQDKFLLGFNEPNFADQSNITPAQAAEAWPRLEKLASDLGLTLVGPALNWTGSKINDGKMYQPKEWMSAFIQEYKNRNGGREPRMDYLALHSYAFGAPWVVQDYVEDFGKTFGNRQVWLTEFCAWDGTDGWLTPALQMQDMIAKLRYLERSDLVYRYAWFKARNANVHPYYNLVYNPNAVKGISAGTLTALGFAYNNMSVFDKNKWYGVDEKIPVNQFVDCINLKNIQKSADPQAVKNVEIGFLPIYGDDTHQYTEVHYQVDVPAGDYKLVVRYTKDDSDNNPTLSVRSGGDLVQRAGASNENKKDESVYQNTREYTSTTLESTGNDDDNVTYKAKVLNVTLPGGSQEINLHVTGSSAFFVSEVKLTKNPSSDDLREVTAERIKSGSTGGTIPSGCASNNTENVTSNDNVKVTDADTDPFKFSADEKYYSIYLDKQTQEKNISSDRFINCGPNGSTQNVYPWDNTVYTGDAEGPNSFGVEGSYMSWIVADKGWSGIGYAVDGGLDLRGINKDYSLHMALKSASYDTFYIEIKDGNGHVAKLVFGAKPWNDNGTKILPIANFKRDDKWHNIDIPMSYLQGKYGLNFSQASNYNENFFVFMAGGEAGTDLCYDGVFFHGPKNGQPDQANSDNGIRITEAATNPFRFSKDDRYYTVYLDGETKVDNNLEPQIVDCGPNGSSRNIYPWDNTLDFPSGTDDNSFGVGGQYMSVRVKGTQGWSGLSYSVAGANSPLNLSGISEDYTLHFAVKTRYAGPIAFQLTDGLGNTGWVVLGDGDYDGHAPIGNFPRNNKWYNIDVPIRYLAGANGLNFSVDNNYTGNFFVVLAGGQEGTVVDYDAVFVYGPKDSRELPTPEMGENREITIKKAWDNRFTFPENSDVYALVLDEEASRDANIKQLFWLGPNGSTQQIYPWSGTVDFGSIDNANSFGNDGYQDWIVTNQGWSGLGYFIKEGSGVDLSGIDGEYTLHFAVKANSNNQLSFNIVDNYGKVCHLYLGGGAVDGVNPIGDFPRNGEWYSVDVPVSYLMKNGLNFTNSTNYSGGNLVYIMGGGNQGDHITYDALFFYGPANVNTIMESVETNRAVAQGVEVYTIGGVRIGSAASLSSLRLPKGIYIVRSVEGTRKVAVR